MYTTDGCDCETIDNMAQDLQAASQKSLDFQLTMAELAIAEHDGLISHKERLEFGIKNIQAYSETFGY
jgi:hypothetical protein